MANTRASGRPPTLAIGMLARLGRNKPASFVPMTYALLTAGVISAASEGSFLLPQEDPLPQAGRTSRQTSTNQYGNSFDTSVTPHINKFEGF